MAQGPARRGRRDSREESELLDYLSAQGLETGNFEERYGAQGFGQSIYINDPDGNTIELKASKPTK